MKSIVHNYLDNIKISLNGFLKHCEKDLLSSANLIAKKFEKGNKILVCGNGGSASDAQHFTAELIGRFKKDRIALPAIALNTDTSAITAIANDYDYKNIFSRQIEGLGMRGDILLAISTSGNSKNIKDAVKIAKKKNIIVIGLTGSKKSELTKSSDLCISVPATETSHIQELHIIVLHLLCILIEKKLF